jgi:hypothetical protein
LTQAASVDDAIPGAAIDKHLGASGGQHSSKPIAPPGREPNVLQQLQQKWPRHGVESFGEVDLQQHSRATLGMQPTTGELDYLEVFVDAPPALDERRLVGPDQFVHARRKTKGQTFREEFPHRVD